MVAQASSTEKIVYFIFPHDPATNEQIITGLTELGEKDTAGTIRQVPEKGRVFLWKCSTSFYKALLAAQAKGMVHLTAYRESVGGTLYAVKTKRNVLSAKQKKAALSLLKKAREVRRRGRQPTPTPPVAA